jgi:hypothetical protein
MEEQTFDIAGAHADADERIDAPGAGADPEPPP